MHNVIKKQQMASRFIYKVLVLSQLDLAQEYFLISKEIQNSGKVMLLDHNFYCFFDSFEIEDFENVKCKVGMNIIGWDTDLINSNYEIKDFSKLEFDRFEIVINENEDLAPQIQKFYKIYAPLNASSFRLTTEIKLQKEKFEIITYLDFFSLVK